MAQQVNLCLPILQKRKTSFTAQNLALALLVLLVVGGALAAAWVWSLNNANASLSATLASQSKELDALRAASESSKLGDAPAQAAAAQTLAQRKTELLQRQKVLSALQEGLFQVGYGHSDRLKLVAQSIPVAVWVTQIKADDRLLDVTGYTVEPAALNDWVSKLAVSPLLKGQALSTVKVESVDPASVPMPGAAAVVQGALSATNLPASRPASAPARALPPLWSFGMLSSMAAPVTPAATAGGKP